MTAKDEAVVRKKRPVKAKAASKETESEMVSLTGSVARRLSEVRASNMNLVLTFGMKSSEKGILVPLIDWQLFGCLDGNGVGSDAPSIGDEVFSSVLTLENVAFLAQDIGEDLRRAITLLLEQTKGSVKPSFDQLTYASSLLREAGTYFTESADLLDQSVSASAAEIK